MLRWREIEQLLNPCLYFIGVILSQRVRKEQFLENLKRPPTLGVTRSSPSSFGVLISSSLKWGFAKTWSGFKVGSEPPLQAQLPLTPSTPQTPHPVILTEWVPCRRYRSGLPRLTGVWL